MHKNPPNKARPGHVMPDPVIYINGLSIMHQDHLHFSWNDQDVCKNGEIYCEFWKIRNISHLNWLIIVKLYRNYISVIYVVDDLPVNNILKNCMQVAWISLNFEAKLEPKAAEFHKNSEEDYLVNK